MKFKIVDLACKALLWALSAYYLYDAFTNSSIASFILSWMLLGFNVMVWLFIDKRSGVSFTPPEYVLFAMTWPIWVVAYYRHNRWDWVGFVKRLHEALHMDYLP